MRIFATEFGIEPHSKEQFVTLVTDWIRGMRHSSLFHSGAQSTLDQDAPVVIGPKGDKLQLHAVDDEEAGVTCQGFRYDTPDGDRIWRIEGVLTQKAEADEGIFRIRGQNLARSGLAELHRPNKPFLIKTLIRDGTTRQDGDLQIMESPHVLHSLPSDLELAEKVIAGQASRFLPAIYVSTRSGIECALSKGQIADLARELGGVAHVIVEPNRGFSFDLKERTAGRNAYGGAIGISIPGRGMVRKLFPRWEDATGEGLKQAALWAAIELRSQMASDGGWDWSQLQERRIRLERLRRPAEQQDTQRRRELEEARAKLETQAERDFAALLQQLDEERAQLQADTTENEALWQEEIASKQDRIRDLENQVAALQESNSASRVDGLLSQEFIDTLGPELWAGEFSDRVLLALRKTLETAESSGLDARSTAVLTAINRQMEFSGGANLASSELAKATTDAKRMAKNLIRVMSSYGFEEKADNKHVRLRPRKGFVGLEPITLPKTPSEHRGLKNQKADIERNLGLRPLKK